MQKAVLLGIDAASWNYLDPLINKGKLPNFTRLKKTASWDNLESTLPASSPQSWTSIFTGTNPGKHRIFDFSRRKSGSYFIEPVFSYDCKSPKIWDYLSEANKKTIAVSIPFCFPVTETNGILTSGLGAPGKNSKFAYPVNMNSYIRNNYPEFDVDFEEHSFDFPADRIRIIKKVKSVTESQFKLVKDLYKNRKWDFFTAVFRSLDSTGHFFFKQPDTFVPFIRQIDRILGWFMDNSGKNTLLFICSDHGMQQVHTSFYVNDWFIRNGFLKISDKKGFHVPVTPERLEKALIKSGLRKLAVMLKKSRFIEYLTGTLFKSRRLSFIANAEWKSSMAYNPGTHNNATVYLNIAGRDPQGIIPVADSYKTYKKIRSLMLKVKYKGKKVIQDVHWKDDIYKYTDNFDGPDMIVEPEPGFMIADGTNPGGGLFEKETKRPGDHSPLGIYAVYSQIRKPRVKKGKYNVYDITPTILKCLGIQIPQYMDGKPMI